jgi:hypothetical protein
VALPKHFARGPSSPDMPAGFIHPFWIELLKEAASQIMDTDFVAVSLAATAEGLPAANGHPRRVAIPLRRRLVIPSPSDSFGHQFVQLCTVHQRSIPGCG